MKSVKILAVLLVSGLSFALFAQNSGLTVNSDGGVTISGTGKAAEPVASNDLATKNYVDTKVAGIIATYTGTFAASTGRAAGGFYRVDKYGNGKMVFYGWVVAIGAADNDLSFSVSIPEAFLTIESVVTGVNRGRQDGVVPTSLTDTTATFSTTMVTMGASTLSSLSTHARKVDLSNYTANDRLIVSFRVEGTK